MCGARGQEERRLFGRPPELSPEPRGHRDRSVGYSTGAPPASFLCTCVGLRVETEWLVLSRGRRRFACSATGLGSHESSPRGMMP